jgi:hypothetical protein
MNAASAASSDELADARDDLAEKIYLVFHGDLVLVWL